MRFQYCSDCGTQLSEREIGDEGMVPFCTCCNKPLFDMFASCIIALVINEFDEVALLNQNYISNKYKNLVSGYMKPGENAECTAIREIKEEIGITVDKLQFKGTYWFDKKDMLMIGFFAFAKKADIVLSGEVDQAEWIPVKEALTMVHPAGSISHTLIEKYILETR